MGSSLFLPSYQWKKVYLDAIMETDPVRIAVAVERAEKIFRAPEFELFNHPDDFDELEAISDARYLLRALLSSLAYRSDAA